MSDLQNSFVKNLSDSPIRISDILRVARKYGLFIVAFACVSGSLAGIWAHFQPSLYDASALIHLDQHSSISLSATGATGDDYALKIQTQITGLHSPDVALASIKKLGLAANPLFNPSLKQNMDIPQVREELVRAFLGSLTVARVPETELISVTFRSRNPVLSALVANDVVDEYFEESFRQKYRSTQDVSTFLSERLDSLKQKIQAEQSDLMSSGLKLGIIDLGGGASGGGGGGAASSSIGTSTLVVETSGLLDQRVKSQADLYLAEAQYENLLHNPDAVPPAIIPGSTQIESLVTQLSSAKAAVAALQDRYGKNYPPLSQARAQVQSIQADIAALHNKLLQSAQQDVESSQAVVKSLDDRIATLKQQSQDSSSAIVHYEVLKAQYLSDQTLYNTLLSTLGSGEIEAGMQMQVLNHFSTALVPGSRAYPNVRVIALAGFAGGLMIAILVVGILTLSSDTVHTVEQIEQSLPLPVLASVPEYKDELLGKSDDGLALVTLLAPRSASAEAYRLLRTSISLMPTQKPQRVIALTSGGPGEGKSTTSLNLAVVLASQSKRVLLIDADLRKPTIAQRLRLKIGGQPGLSRFLSDPTINAEECIQSVPDIPGLEIMPVQEIPPFPSELLSQPRLAELLEWARLHYDYVLIDTPPVLLVTDALIITRQCDTLLVVARIGVAQRRALARIRQDVAKYPEKQFGIIVNALPFSESYYSGYGNYRKYYGDGYGGYGTPGYFQDGLTKDKAEKK